MENNKKNSCTGCQGGCVSDSSVGFDISEDFKRFNQKMTSLVDHFGMKRLNLKKLKDFKHLIVNH